MATTVNLLSDGNALRRFSSLDGTSIGLASVEYDWTATNANLMISGTDFIVDSRYTLVLASGSEGEVQDVVLTLAGIPLTPDDNGSVLSANMQIKANAPITVSSLLYIDSASATYEPYSKTYSSGSYNAVHTNRAVVPDDENIHTATIQITISGLVGGQTAHITMPHLIHDLALFGNSFLGKARNFLPDFYFEIDSLQSQPSYPFFRLLDILTSTAGEVFAEYGLMYGIEGSELLYENLTVAYWAQSSLVSPRSVKNKYVSWLSQFSGDFIRQNIYYSNGNPFFGNESIRRDFIEWQLSKGYYGRAAGSRIAMVEAAKQVLSYTDNGAQSTFSVSLTPRYQDEPFAIHIRTLANETPDANANQVSELVMQSVNWAKPMGYLITHETVNQFNFTLGDPVLGSFDSMTFG